VLADEAVRPPHVAYAEQLPHSLTVDSRWTLVRRIFDVGFKPEVDLRFQTADELIQRIDEILQPTERPETAPRSQAELQAFNDQLVSAIIAAKLRIEKTMLCRVQGSLNSSYV